MWKDTMSCRERWPGSTPPRRSKQTIDGPRRIDGITRSLPPRAKAGSIGPSADGSEPFLVCKNLRCDEPAFIELVENPDLVDYCAGKMFELAYRGTLRSPGAGGGSILGPCHNTQVVSPPENVVATYETGYYLGWQ